MCLASTASIFRFRPGITSLVGPNGSGKTTLMNLMTGLIRPTCGSVSVLGLTPDQPEEYFRAVGYCTQFDSFAKGITGREFVRYRAAPAWLSRRKRRRSEPTKCWKSSA